MSKPNGMTLGELIERLKESPRQNKLHLSLPGFPVWGVREPCSYRGYYDQLALQPHHTPASVAEVIAMLEDALGKSFEGYKGGEFIMGHSTRVWIAEYGSSSGMRVYAVEDIDNLIEKYTTLLLILDSYS